MELFHRIWKEGPARKRVCAACCNAQSRKAYLANPEYYRAKSLRWGAENKEARKLYNAKNYDKRKAARLAKLAALVANS